MTTYSAIRGSSKTVVNNSVVDDRTLNATSVNGDKYSGQLTKFDNSISFRQLSYDDFRKLLSGSNSFNPPNAERRISTVKKRAKVSNSANRRRNSTTKRKRNGATKHKRNSASRYSKRTQKQTNHRTPILA